MMSDQRRSSHHCRQNGGRHSEDVPRGCSQVETGQILMEKKGDTVPFDVQPIQDETWRLFFFFVKDFTTLVLQQFDDMVRNWQELLAPGTFLRLSLYMTFSKGQCYTIIIIMSFRINNSSNHQPQGKTLLTL